MQNQSVVVMNGLIEANKFTGANDTCLHTARNRVIQHAINLSENTQIEENGVLDDCCLEIIRRCNELNVWIIKAKIILECLDGYDNKSPYNLKLINYIRKE